MRLCSLALVLACAVPACRDRKKPAAQVTASEARDLQKRGQDCFLKGDYGCAMESLKTVLKARPSDPDLLNRFAMAARLRYYQSGDMDFRDQELEALRKAVKLQPRSAIIQVNFGTTAWELGMRKEAARAYQRALELAPKHPDAALMRRRIKRSTAEVEDEEEG